MTEHTDGSPNTPEAARPVVKKHRSISIVWLVPVVALLIGAWLVYKAVTEKGPTITITFESAEGLEAGKTKIKFKDVDVGRVEKIELDEDLFNVKLTVEMTPDSDPYLTENTKFWVVRARVAAGQVTGLGTLFSGAYIGIEPATEGKKMRHFTGLEKPPIVTGEMEGKHFSLVAPRLASLNPGSPIYFRQIKVGQVVDFELDEAGNNVGVSIFVHSPYDQFVRRNTRFWIASGLDVSLTADGLRIDTESVVSLMIGGIGFGTFPNEPPQPEAEEDTHFKLYETRQEARESRYIDKRDFIIEFKDSVRGLSVGAPVEFRGLKIGEVTNIVMKADFEKLDFTIPVRVRLEPERLALSVAKEEEKDRWQRLIAKGLRAQLNTGNLLTGQLYIDFKFFKDAPPAEIIYSKGLPVIPSVPSSSQEIMQGITRFVKKLDQVPLDEIGRELKQTVAGLNRFINDPELPKIIRKLRRIFDNLEQTTQTLNEETVPQINASLVELDGVIQEMDGWVSADAPLQSDLRKTLRDLSEAARAISELADMLGRHPEALIQGKGNKE